MRVAHQRFTVAAVAAAFAVACGAELDNPPQGCDEVWYDNLWSQLDLKLYLDFIEDCPWGGVAEGDTLSILGSVEDLDYDDVHNPNPTTVSADLLVHQKIDDQPCLGSFWGPLVSYESEYFWYSGSYPNRRWVVNIGLQYPAKQGDASGDCVEFEVYDSYYGGAQAHAEVVYN